MMGLVKRFGATPRPDCVSIHSTFGAEAKFMDTQSAGGRIQRMGMPDTRKENRPVDSL